MQSTLIPAPAKPTAPTRGLQFLIEPEPWLRVFTRNLGDLFRPSPPPVWVTAKPAEYWPDALVHRPVAWRSARRSFLAHALVILAVYAINLAWLNHPQIVATTPPKTTTLHYELSEYLPAVTPHTAKPAPPRRARPQKADPEYAVQEIVVTNENHISTRQTIVQPSPVLLKQDVPLPNLIISATIPGAPVASHHPLQVLPLNAPQVAPPAAPVQSNLHPLIFPPAAAPVVAAPPSPVTTTRPMRALPLEGPVVVPPAPDIVARNAQALQLPAQAPPEVAAPPAEIAVGHPAQALPLTAPEVAPPAPSSVGRNLSSLGLPSADHTVAPPAQPISTGGSAREKELGQLLVLNARPVAPNGPLTVPEGNRPGEFAAGPEGRPGATARPEIKAGDSASATNHSSNGSDEIYISAPPARTTPTANAVMAAPPPSLASRPITPDRTDGRPADHIDTQVFGTRRHYSMRLSMPNLSSSVGSWTVRFAELNASGPAGADLSAPEAVSKVDPAYPQELIHDHIEGVVVLYAIIRSDGSVDAVRILEGFDERLNENARKALQQWRFRPGTKNGLPVDIEAVVRVPFRVPRNPF